MKNHKDKYHLTRIYKQNMAGVRRYIINNRNEIRTIIGVLWEQHKSNYLRTCGYEEDLETIDPIMTLSLKGLGIDASF